jgi:hypothetical protein
MIISHNLIECGRREGNKNEIDGVSGRISEMVRNGMDRVKNVKPYVVQQVINAKAEGRSRMCLPTRLWSGCWNTWMIAVEVMIIQIISSGEW